MSSVLNCIITVFLCCIELNYTDAVPVAVLGRTDVRCCYLPSRFFSSLLLTEPLSSTLFEFTVSYFMFSSCLLFQMLVTVTATTASQTVLLLNWTIAALSPPSVVSWLGRKVFLDALLACNHGDALTGRLLILCVQREFHWRDSGYQRFCLVWKSNCIRQPKM